jgi:hypothetical protein
MKKILSIRAVRMKMNVLLGVASCGLLLSACVSNPPANRDTSDTAGATNAVPAPAPVRANAPAIQKKVEVSAVKVEAPSNAPGNDQLLVAEKRSESTGLLGKTLVSKKKYSKSWHGELDYFNNFAKFYASGAQKLPANTKVLALIPDKRNKNKEYFAFVKESGNTTYFIDILEVDVPKGLVVSYEECNLGSVGLFRESNTVDQNFSKPVKAWNVVDGRFALMTNTNRMECRKPFED